MTKRAFDKISEGLTEILTDAKDQRIRDLERENAELKECVEMLLQDAWDSEKTMHTALASKRDLEREVERLKPFEAKAERWFSEIEQRGADRADAERFRYWFGSSAGKLDAWRALIDADRAEEGEAATCAENAQVRSAAMAKDPQL